MGGWIKLHRKIISSSVFDNPHLLKMWIWCLSKATHKEYKQVIGLEEITLTEGQFITGRHKGSLELSVNQSTWYKHLKSLEKLNMISIKSNNKMTTVSIVNWRLYQDEEKEKEQQSNNEITTKEQQSNTNKNDKNIKNDKNKDIYTIFDHWNSKGIIEHKELTAKRKGHISAKLENYSVSEITEAIDLYAEVLSNDKYYWTHKWTLEHLLTRGFDNFLAKNDPLNNYLGRNKQNGKYDTVGGKSDDEFEKIDWAKFGG